MKTGSCSIVQENQQQPEHGQKNPRSTQHWSSLLLWILENSWVWNPWWTVTKNKRFFPDVLSQFLPNISCSSGLTSITWLQCQCFLWSWRQKHSLRPHASCAWKITSSRDASQSSDVGWLWNHRLAGVPAALLSSVQEELRSKAAFWRDAINQSGAEKFASFPSDPQRQETGVWECVWGRLIVTVECDIYMLVFG